MAKGPKTYKAAKGASGRGNFSNLGQKPALRRRISAVDRKVKQVAKTITPGKPSIPGPAAHNRY